jgi:hypothetical protein
MDMYKTESSTFFFFPEALEHGFAMAGAALGRRCCWERERKSKGGGGLTGAARMTDDACWAVHTRWLKEELRGVLRTEAVDGCRCELSAAATRRALDVNVDENAVELGGGRWSGRRGGDCEGN